MHNTKRTPSLERLESRDCPSTITFVPGGPGIGNTVYVQETGYSSTIVRQYGTDGVTITDRDDGQLTLVAFNHVSRIVFNGSDKNNSFVDSSHTQDEVYLSGGNDRAVTYGDDAILDGGDGNDTLYAFGGNSLMIGGAGNDRLVSNSSTNVMLGGSGTDTFYGPGVIGDLQQGEKHYG